ncbi:Cell surface spherulin 4-like protein [Penicillium bovifimosum]|uniref:Cell surface spherulin 4-like protein n=1 Tax=Penicillium bovifimosum TaxID=126998 RepID=A0A9W9KZY7_9EURO|nr:Cell surface spherulin 4-like protein [Penicillium bovifimosum]KAJ5129514.1 Cell surface spherulin 4-like protein [Penicillium bovifimosum]
MLRFLSILATVLFLPSPSLSTGLLIPLYSYPGTDAWDPIYTSIATYPTIPFYLIINPSSGPGQTTYPEAAFITSIAKINSYPNARVLGYTHTSRGTRPSTEVEDDIAAYANWSSYKEHNIALSGIFFDQVSDGEDGTKLAYFQSMAEMAKKNGLETVVFNPGVRVVGDVEGWFKAADLVVECEDTYDNWLALGPEEHFAKEGDYGKDAVILNRTPVEADIGGVVGVAKGLGIGAIYLTHDEDYMSYASVPKVAVAIAQGRRIPRAGV